MTEPLRIALLGATGNLGRHIASQVLQHGWTISVGVRNRGRLPAEVAAQAQVVDMDLASATVAQLARFADGHDAFIFCAGVVTEGDAFVTLFDKAVSAIEALPASRRPVSWFLAGAALLPLDSRGRLGVDLPKVRDTYGPHRRNFARLQASPIDWRLLCPGPMVEQPALGLGRLRVAIDRLPAPLPAIAASLPGPLLLPLFALAIPTMIVPYADAAAVMLARLGRDDSSSRCRVGVALPEGMRGRKDQWAAAPKSHG